MYRGKTHFCLPGKWFELLYSSKQSSSTSFIAPAAAVLSLSQVSQRSLHKSFLSGFYSLVIKLTLDHGDSWDSSSSVECMLTNQLPIKKGKKDDRNFRVLLDFIKVCLCEVYKDQKWVVARNQRRSEWTNIVHESIFVGSILSTLLAAVLPNGTCTLCLKQVPL